MRLLTGTVVVTILLLAVTSARAVSLDVLLGQTRLVRTGEVFDTATVRNGGILILDGGTISNGSPSITVEAGGRFIFNAGQIRYFENWGSTEIYGGTQGSPSSENRGYLKYAGGDPGIQVVHIDGRLDVYYVPTNRINWEIYTYSTNGNISIHLYTFANSLSAGTYTYNTLPGSFYHATGKEYWDIVTYWTPGPLLAGRQITLNVESNWPGKVWVHDYIPVPAFTSAVRPAVEVTWGAVSGHSYQVQYSTILPGNEWKSLGPPVHSVSPTGSVCDTAYDTNKMYRVLLRN